MIVEVVENIKLLCNAAPASESYPKRLAKALYGFIGAIVEKGERNVFHFTNFAKNQRKCWEENIIV